MAAGTEVSVYQEKDSMRQGKEGGEDWIRIKDGARKKSVCVWLEKENASQGEKRDDTWIR